MTHICWHNRVALALWPYVLGVLLVVGINRLEYAVFPVVSNFHITHMDRQTDAVTLSGVMRQERQCTFVGVTAKAELGGESLVLPMALFETPVPAAEKDKQHWGPWKLTIPSKVFSGEVELMAWHRCHSLWASQTDLIRIPLFLEQTHD